MPLSSIKLIAFDLDGTLLDSVPDLATATNQALAELGYPLVDEQQVRDWVGNGADALLARAINRNMSTEVASAELAQQARQLFDRFYKQTNFRFSVLYPGVRDSLQRLKLAGFKLAMVTNKPSQFIPEILRQHRLEETFDDVLGADCVDNIKPHPEALIKLMQQYQLTATQVIMVGDSKNDILTAHNAQCVSFGLSYGYNHGEPIANANPDYLGDSVKELVDLLL